MFNNSSKVAVSQTEIWLDGRNISRSGGTGIYYYASNHRSAIEKIGLQTAWLLEDTTGLPTYPTFQRAIRSICSYPSPISTASFQSQWGKAYLSHDLYRIAHLHYRTHGRILKLRPAIPPSIMHWTCPLPTLIEGCRNIVTIHDLIPLTHPDLTGIDGTRFYHLIKNLIENSVEFVAISETVRQQMLKFFSLSERQITTLYQPVEFDDGILEEIKNAPRIAPPDSFIFYGRVENRKNIERLLTAHALSQTNTPLAIIGPYGDDEPDCSPKGPTSTIIRLPWSKRLSLLRTLLEAKALLFPSLAEGFGIPIIEAMSLGTPVLTSKGGATEEIAGGAAYLCSPTGDITELVQGISYFDTLSPEEKKSIIQKGYERAKFFSTLHYTEKLKEFYFM
ncbi:glycosyltransferase family 4 protein [Bombella sp. TMW 2.2543]|uniref:Glycosyltransferase family 4 protein n=1 Tax=Bombella pluederhausensis TaxID=2967336 RepID=A0ABT3WFK0_9PROT|nr:glycosyltransferase family 1 protein [Bombella pluederhausensis]MCX5617633.1 glycosyltransferase family 4 protein [Bombella pluederhausensis]